jgi:hypothetical protein
MRFGMGVLVWAFWYGRFGFCKNLFLAQLFLQGGRLAGSGPKVPPHLPKDTGQLNRCATGRAPRRELGISRARVRRRPTYGVGST